MKYLISIFITLFSASVMAYTSSKAEVDAQVAHINQCNFSNYVALKKAAEQSPNEYGGAATLKIKVDGRVSKMIIRENFGIQRPEDKNNNQHCLRKLSDYK